MQHVFPHTQLLFDCYLFQVPQDQGHHSTGLADMRLNIQFHGSIFLPKSRMNVKLKMNNEQHRGACFETECTITLQSHRMSFLIPTESAYRTSYWSSIATYGTWM